MRQRHDRHKRATIAATGQRTMHCRITLSRLYWDPRTRVVVVLLDTRYLDPAISELHAGGYEVQDEDGTRLS